MDPILQVVRYLFMKKNISNIEDDFNSFFKNGVSFPNLVAIALNIEKVPKINSKPLTIFHKNINNNIACQYLFEKCPEIAKIAPNFDTSRDQANFISLILTKIIFKMSFQEIIDKCNQIVMPLKKYFKGKHELLDVKSLLMLLNALTDGKVPYDIEIINVNQTLTQSFEMAEAPLVINETSFQFQNQFLFFIQIQIIFDFFSAKIESNLEKLTKGDQTAYLPKEKPNELNTNDNQVKDHNEDNLQNEEEEEYLDSLDDDDYKKEEENDEFEPKSLENINELDITNIQIKEKGIVAGIKEDNEIKNKEDKPKSEDEEIKAENSDEIQKIEDEDENGKKENIKNNQKFGKEENFEDIQEFEEEDEEDKEENIESRHEFEVDEDLTENKEDKLESKDEEKQKDKKKKKKKKKRSINYDVDNDIILEGMNGQVLLDTLNEIGKKADIHFDNFQQSVEPDNLQKFVKFIVEDYDEITLDPEEWTEDLVQTVIKKLSKIEPAFSVLLLDFDDINYIESSAISFYTNLLDFFFLKQSKKQMYDRVYTILYGKYNKQDKKFKSYLKKNEILTDWSTYMKLICFAFQYKGKTTFDHLVNANDEQISLFADTFIKDKTVPIVISEAFLDKYKPEKDDQQKQIEMLLPFNSYNQLPFGIYYQLQFIFDVMEEKIESKMSKESSEIVLVYKNNVLIELFLTAITKLKMIQCPNFGQLVKSIRAKNLSLILQKRRARQNEKLKIINAYNDDENEEENETNSHSHGNELPPKPSTFINRCLVNSYKIDSERPKRNNSVLIINALTYWNKPNLKYDFYKGILFNKKDRIEENCPLRFDELLSYASIDSKKRKRVNSIKDIYIDFTKDNQKHELHKLFHYDEKKLTWMKDDYNKFINFITKAANGAVFPIVSIIDSYENEQISLISKLLKSQYPDFDDDFNDQIFVYGISELELPSLTLDYVFNEKEINNKPVFLLLHVPEKARKRCLPYIRKIILQIYTYLAYISDFSIVILNREFCVDQIELINDIQNLRRSYGIRPKNELKDLVKLKNNLKNKISSENNEEEDFDDSDSDEFNDDDDGNENNSKKDDDDKNEEMYLLHPFFNKKMKFVFLINDPKITYNKPKNDLNKASIFKCLNNDDKIIKNIFYINIENTKTYSDFLDYFHESAIQSDNFDINVKGHFNRISLFNMSGNYIDLKLQKVNSQKTLYELVERRLKDLKPIYPKGTDGITLISELTKEIAETFPQVDFDYHHMCNVTLSNLRRSNSRGKADIFETELMNSSKSSLDYIREIMKTQPYWENEQLEGLINSHIHFLTEEYFSIIQYFYKPKLFATIYEDNLAILEKRISDDRNECKNIFGEFEKRRYKKIKSIHEMQSTNYTIRERENEQEVKVRVDIDGKLEDLINQDF